jgi:hypothetical protein
MVMVHSIVMEMDTHDCLRLPYLFTWITKFTRELSQRAVLESGGAASNAPAQKIDGSSLTYVPDVQELMYSVCSGVRESIAIPIA